ncbi:AIR synthase family protein [Anaerofustis stercorihominis]|uniref:AIR synthase family protein n=1 Tax=Anaerofustis stercorihominis TaxID=214853 RepID=UPI00214C0244|nr:AIR synthase family protein [Anaerofustis stercorihominis]MCR2031970.1 AIR synthase family protein [Anaerofustis stercorihominis]
MNDGKLSNENLEKILFNKIKIKNKEVMIGAGIGKDTAMLDFKNDLFIISTDPITGSKNGIGKLCVNISCNDIATAMARPVAMMITMLIPTYAKIKDVEEIIDEILLTCDENDVDLIGGHTEVTSSVNKFILSGVCIGKKEKREGLSPRAGDKIVMSKYAGLEGSAIAALDLEEEIKKILSDDELKRTKELINHTNVIKEGLIAKDHEVSLLHDATEGGVLGGVWEMATNSGLGAVINIDEIPILNETKKITEHFDIDPYKLISSGVMLFITPKDKELIEALKRENIPANTIGYLTEEKEIYTIKNNKKELLEPPKQDELYKIIK